MERESIPLMHIRHEFKEDHLDRSNGKLIRTDCFFAAEQQDLPIYTNGVEFAERRAPTWYHDSCNRYFLVTFLTEGSIRYWAGGEQFTVHAKQILLIPQGMDYRFETLRNPHYRKNTLFLLGVNLAEILETFQLNQPMILPAEDSDFLAERFHQLREIVQSRDSRLLPRNMGITMELLGRMAERGPSSEHLPLTLRIAKSRLSGGFGNAVSIAALAQELRMPLRTFNRMFRDNLPARVPEAMPDGNRERIFEPHLRIHQGDRGTARIWKCISFFRRIPPDIRHLSPDLPSAGTEEKDFRIKIFHFFPFSA